MEDFYATLESVKQRLHVDPPEWRKGKSKTKGEIMLLELMKEMARKDVSVEEFREVMEDLRGFLDKEYHQEFFFMPGYMYLKGWVCEQEFRYSCFKAGGVPEWMKGCGITI